MNDFFDVDWYNDRAPWGFGSVYNLSSDSNYSTIERFHEVIEEVTNIPAPPPRKIGFY